MRYSVGTKTLATLGLLCLLLCFFWSPPFSGNDPAKTETKTETRKEGKVRVEGNFASSNLKQFVDKNLMSVASVRKIYKAYLVVCILSAPNNFKARDTIRKTWARVQNNNTNVLFVVGLGNVENETRKTLIKENDNHQDIVFLKHFKESYANLTLKTVETIQLAYHNFMFHYLMKVDDDSFLRLDLILKLLSNKPKHRFYWGYFMNRGPILRTGKWAEPKEYICDHYVSYAAGWGYVLSRDLIQYIAQNSDILIKFKNEDVSVGTWLAPLDIHRIHDSGFRLYSKWKENLSENCTENVFLLNPVPLRDMTELSYRLAMNGTLCRITTTTEISRNSLNKDPSKHRNETDSKLELDRTFDAVP